MTAENEQQIPPAEAGGPTAATGDAIPEADAPEPSIFERPTREAELEAEVVKLKDQLVRALAETENVRRRLEQQAEERGKYAVSGFARDILTVADNLRRAIEHVPAEGRDDPFTKNLLTGVEMTERELLAVLERHGIKPIEAQGQKFDPHVHQAMMEVEDPSKPAGTVVMVAQSGYTISGRLLRPAMVGVSKGGPRPAPGEGDPGRVDTLV